MSRLREIWEGELTEGTFWTGDGPMKMLATMDKFPARHVHIRVPDGLLRVLGERMIKQAEELGL